MVDALRATHRALRPRGVLIDLRPDASRPPRLVAGCRVRGTLAPRSGSRGDDLAADAAVSAVVEAGLFRRGRGAGHLWHGTTFASLAELSAYVRSNRRWPAFAPGARSALAPFRDGPIVCRRAVKFELLDHLAP